MGKASMASQVKHLADEHDMRGQSKREIRKENMDNHGMSRNEATRDGIYSSSTRSDFIREGTHFGNYCKQNFGVKLLKDITPKMFTSYWSGHVSKLAPTTQATYLDHLKRLDLYIEQKGWSKGFLNGSNTPSRQDRYKSIVRQRERAEQNGRENSYSDTSFKNVTDTMPKINRSSGIAYKDIMIVFKETGIRTIGFQRVTWGDVKGDVISVIEKHGRPRDIPLTKEAKEALERIKQATNPKSSEEKIFGKVRTRTLRDAETTACRRLGEKLKSNHALRHMYAKQNFLEKYLDNRRKGMSISDARIDARAYVSHLVGHGNPKEDRGRVSVTYIYVSGKDGAQIEAFAEQILANEAKNNKNAN